MALRGSLLVVAVVLGCLSLAAAQCIECKSCQGSSFCLSNCKRECPKAPPPPPTISITTCQNYGTQAGKDAAKFACELTLNYCQALVQPRRMAPPRVTLQQCGNAAYGVCQSTANTASMSPCGNAFNGISKCSKSEFEKFYNGLVDESCNQKASVFDKPQGR